MTTRLATTLGALLTDNARRHPDRIAIVCDGRRVTYGALDVLSNRLANTLIERGITPGDRAAVYLPNGIELVVALCGVLRAGAIVVPVSTRLAAAEVDIMMEELEARGGALSRRRTRGGEGICRQALRSVADLR